MQLAEFRCEDRRRNVRDDGTETPAAGDRAVEAGKAREAGDAVQAVGTLGRLPGILAEPEERCDRDLIAAAKKGSHSAFEALVRRYSERAYRVAYRVVRDADAADEVLQEALIKAYRGLPRFELRSTFYTWLYRIVVNLALDRRRQAKRAPDVEWEDSLAVQLDPRGVVPGQADPELAARRVEVRELVSKGIQELPDGQREVLLLREIEDLSYEEIAKAMGISKGTVMSRLHYARKKMIAYLEAHDVAPEDVVR
ncbi:MAG: sigma-70 family RNA polymerase sigma factor [Myxococcota bacterium]